MPLNSIFLLSAYALVSSCLQLLRHFRAISAYCFVRAGIVPTSLCSRMIFGSPFSFSGLLSLFSYATFHYLQRQAPLSYEPRVSMVSHVFKPEHFVELKAPKQRLVLLRAPFSSSFCVL